MIGIDPNADLLATARAEGAQDVVAVCRILQPMERTVRIVPLKSRATDRAYWQHQPVEARLAAIEFLRQQFMGPTHAEQRLQRVCRIAQKA